MNPQQAENGQNSETTRRTLKITARLTAVAAASGRNADKMQIRDRVVRIDEMLAGVETALTKVVERNIPDADRSEQFRILDTQLGDIRTYVAELRNETKGRQFAFVGLQMVHISRTQVAPARDRIFIAIREPLGTDNPTNALYHIVRAREMLVEVDHPVAGTRRYASLPYHVSEASPTYERANLLGEHTDEVLAGKLGYDDRRLAQLRDGGVI